jgi:uncharacterized protein YndB with AHSA1/START domain
MAISNEKSTVLTVATTVHAPVEKVWECWTIPIHIMHWNHASDDWHTSRAENDFHAGGKFSYRMESRDGKSGFDFSGTYTRIVQFRQIEIMLDDNRTVVVFFDADKNETHLNERFEAEHINPPELQRGGWQAILEHFRKYVETSGSLGILHFNIAIDASPDKVYRTLIDKKGFTEWTSVFNAASHFEGTWEKGTKMLFLGKDADGKTGGMASRIKENIAGRFISIEHLNIIKDDQEITSGPEFREWTGALENYSITGDKEKTFLSVDVNTNEEFRSYFRDTWPKALDKLKVLCEEEKSTKDY